MQIRHADIFKSKPQTLPPQVYTGKVKIVDHEAHTHDRSQRLEFRLFAVALISLSSQSLPFLPHFIISTS